MPDVFGIADILVKHTIERRQDDVAIVAYYGSHAAGHATATSDLDIFYIPDDGKARMLCAQFVLDGLPYDYWPISWDLAETLANAKRDWAVSASIIADAHVLHHRSQADLDRFNGLKARIEELTSPEGRKYMVERSVDEFRTVLSRLGMLRIADDPLSFHAARWQFVNSVVNCLAIVNQRYFRKGWGASLAQVASLPLKPAGVEAAAEVILTSEDAGVVLDTADRLAREVRAILLDAQREIAQPPDPREVFANFYFYVFEYTNKILSACERGDALAADAAALLMQDEISQLMNQAERGFADPEFGLLGQYSGPYRAAGFPDLLVHSSKGNLAGLAQAVRRLDEMMRAWLTGQGIELGILVDENDLRRFLHGRDPR